MTWTKSLLALWVLLLGWSLMVQNNPPMVPPDVRALVYPCPYRISSRDIIHGPDSPHWTDVAMSRCYPTRAAAEKAVE